MKRRQWLRWGLAAIALLYLLFVYGGADLIIIGPRFGWFDAGTARSEVVKSSGRAVEVWIARDSSIGNREPAGYVLEFCGSGTRAEQIAQYVAARWKNQRLEAWVMNNPGVGGSEGLARLQNIPPAALAVFDEIRRRGGTRPIFVEANSLGTNAALCVAAQRDVAGCVLHDPVPLKQLILGEYGWWNLWLVAGPVAWRIPDDLDAIQNAARVKAPAVFILADKDDFVPQKYHRMVSDRYAGEKKFVIFHGGHWDSVSGDSEKQLQQELEWLWEARHRN